MMLTVSAASMFRLSRARGIAPRKSSPWTPQNVKSSSALVMNSESGSSGTEAGRPGVDPGGAASKLASAIVKLAATASGTTWWFVSKIPGPTRNPVPAAPSLRSSLTTARPRRSPVLRKWKGSSEWLSSKINSSNSGLDSTRRSACKLRLTTGSRPS